MAVAVAEHVEEPRTGCTFPAKLITWEGKRLTSLGAGLRVMGFGFVKVKVYAIALYVDEETVRSRGYDAIAEQTTAKAIVFELVRTITSKDFSGALMRSQRPRMRGEEHFVDMMEHAMGDRVLHKGMKGTCVCLYDGVAQGEALIEGDRLKYPTPGVHVPSTRLCFNLFDVYIGEGSFTPEARKVWIENADRLRKGKSIKYKQ